ncbi:MAG: putative helicase [Microbacteriaceae bacterium]|jgi:hypothetical protein|nr:putative helicase [Microbacteriaceae bacterium]
MKMPAGNSEADNSIGSLKLGNVVTAKKRLDVTRDAIAKLGGLMEMRISDEFNNLRIEEIELTADWLMKKQEEREEQREQRAALWEEQRVARELAEEREMKVRSICVHGDRPNVVEIATAVRKRLEASGILVKSIYPATGS